VLAYVFWHRPRPGTPSDDYEHALLGFHRSLARTPPVGLRCSAAFRATEIPWLPGPERGYEDWYVVDDFAALGVLNEAAVGRGHRSAHDRAAHYTGDAAGGLYRLLEGDTAIAWDEGERCDAIWVAPAAGSGERERGLGELLGDGMNPASASLWRRLLVLGPAPEYCLIAREASAGVASTRLPDGWSARTVPREVLHSR
jgi:hypothetical protein